MGRLRPRYTATHTVNQNFLHHALRQALLFQNTAGDALLFPQKTQQQMLGTDIAVPQITGGTLRQLQRPLGTRGKSVFIHFT